MSPPKVPKSSYLNLTASEGPVRQQSTAQARQSATPICLFMSSSRQQPISRRPVPMVLKYTNYLEPAWLAFTEIMRQP